MEYEALRATIRVRATTRVCAFMAGICAWAALALATAVLTATPLAVLLPLLVLAATFEAVFALHTGVERIGGYLECFHEDRWEHAVSEFGRPRGAVHVDALFSVPFATAVLLNLAPLLVANAVPVEWIFIGGAHGLVVLRLVTARVAAVRQRAIDRERFTELLRQTSSSRS
jgi:hypothetical protein